MSSNMILLYDIAKVVGLLLMAFVFVKNIRSELQ